jgi:hypothetical protein
VRAAEAITTRLLLASRFIQQGFSAETLSVYGFSLGSTQHSSVWWVRIREDRPQRQISWASVEQPPNRQARF